MQGLTDGGGWRATVIFILEHPDNVFDQPDGDVLAYVRLVE
jgi:hypothetical protein